MPAKGLSKEVMLQMRAEGKSNYEIAQALGCRPQNIYYHIGPIKQYKPRAERAKEEIAEQAG
jgi:transcriptional regulator